MGLRETFEKLLVDCPGDAAVRLVYADWLEEHDEYGRAGALRRDARRLAHAPRRSSPERQVVVLTCSNTGLPNSYGYARHVLRVVERRLDQNGWRSERGVIVHWESDHFAAFSRGPRSKYARLLAEARDVAAAVGRDLLGVDDGPDDEGDALDLSPQEI